jgi:DNA repair exonuclease SbcCD ATPase subunit
MLALQSMSTQNSSTPTPKAPETPPANVTNPSTAMVKVPQSLEALSNQILTLTDIATTLQKEMSLLSRRSRDNATDLLSLKEATNARDEDIRKSLRELISDAKMRSASKDPYGGPLLLEGRHHSSSPTQLTKSVRPFSLPRIPSPNSFAASLDTESMLSTPSLVPDSPTTVALLEKIIREMGTREGQDTLLARLTELAGKLSGMATAEKVEELACFVKSNQQQAVVPAGGGGRGGGGGKGGRDLEWDFDEDEGRSRHGAFDFIHEATQAGRLLPGQEGRRPATPGARAVDVVNEEVLKAIRTVKDSVAQGGGLTAETKALVRELRGEVLGMGREIGRRLDEITEKGAGKAEAANKAEMAKVIEEGLAEMNQQMNNILREHRRQSAATFASRESSIDYKEIYNSVRAALKDTQANKPRVPELRREDVIHAVKDAWEKYKPEIEIQQIGLERDEILACLQEGLRAYAPRDNRPPGATRDEVFDAVVEALKHWVPPKVETPATLSRDEILEAVRECLEEFEFPVAPSAMGAELSREDMLDAVKEGLHSFDFPAPPPPPPPPPSSDLTREDVLDAVNEGLQSFDFTSIYANALVPQSVSKSDVSDAVKQGLKSLDLSADMVEAVREGVETLDLQTNVLQAVKQALQGYDFSTAFSSIVIPRPDLSRVDVADAVKDGIECLDLTNSITLAVKQALEGFDFPSANASALIPHPDTSRVNVANAVKEGLEAVDLSQTVTEAVKKVLENFDFSGSTSALVTQPDLSRADVVAAVKEGLGSTDISKDVTEAVKQVLEAFDFSASTAALIPRPDLSRVDVVDAVKEGLESFDVSSGLGDVVRKELQGFDFSSLQSSALVPQTGNNDEIVQRLLEIKDFLQAEFKAVSEEAKQNIAANARDTEQFLDATKDGFEKLRQDMESYVDRARGESDLTKSNEQLLRTLDGFRDEVAELVTRFTDDSRALLQEEIESLRDAVNSSLIPALPQPGNHKEVLEAIHEGLSSLRTEISTRPIAGLTEILDALQEGLGDIRTSLNNLRDKPADLTANDEILEALKTGLDSVRSDIDDLREDSKNDRALATINNDSNAIVPVEQMLKHDDIKNLEVLITQLGVKVEAMEAHPPEGVPSLSKEDLAGMEETLRNVAESVAGMPSREPFEAIQESIQKLQETVAELAARDPAAPSAPASTDAATREDVEAIETILRNTKARLDDLMDGEQAVRKDHIDALETLVAETRDNLTGVSTQMESLTRKEQVEALETLILETRESLRGLTSQMDILSRKEDVAMVESLVTQVIAAFDEMKERHEKALEDPEKVTKTDVDAVEAVCLDTKVLIEQIVKADLASLPSKEDIDCLELRLRELGERMEAHADANVKSFEERQAETVGVGIGVSEMKALLEEFQAVARAKLEDGARGIDSIHTILDALSDSIRKNENIGDDLKEVLDTMKLEFEDSKTAVVGAKLELDEKLQAVADTMVAKFDERVAELIAKYEELQLLQDDRAAKGEARDIELEAAVSGTKSIAEELKSLVDTLGAAVTDSMEKMEEASKTVFERVEDLATKSNDNHSDAKAEHQLTREQVQEAIGKVEGLQGQVSEYQPKILETVQHVMALLGEHYDHLKTSTMAIQERVERPLLPPPPEKYDDTLVLEKLETLVGHAQVAHKAFEQLETLEKVHAQVKHTAAELAAFLAAQTQRIADEHEDREKTLQDTIIALERRLEEKKQVEAQIESLREEEARLKESITVKLPEEQREITQQFLANLQAEETRLKEATVVLRDEQDQLKEVFLTNLKDEQARLMETNVALKEEQDQLKEAFLANLKEEQARLMETNVSLKEEQDKLKEAFLANLAEEELRLKEMNNALREEQQVLKDTFLANLREEESLLKEVNAGLRDEQQQLRETLLANFKEEEQKLRETNDALREEQEQLKAKFKEEHEQLKAALKEEYEQLKATLKEENERLKVELLTNLMEEEARLKEANSLLREEQEQLRVGFFATLKEEEERLKDSLILLRADQENLSRQKSRLTADLSSLDTALRLRREELHDMEARAEGLERRILEGVMDHSRVLLMAKTNRANGRDSMMSRKRVSSTHQPAETPQPAASNSPAPNENAKRRSAINMAMSARSKANTPTANSAGASRRILSLSQITNNVPTGGIKRSQSVRTAVAPARLRKSSWAGAGGGGNNRATAAEDKENIGLPEMEEEGESRYSDGHDRFDTSPPVAPAVDIIVDDAPAAGADDGRLAEGLGDGDFERLDDDVGEAEGGGTEMEAETDTARDELRRASHGTTVVTPAEDDWPGPDEDGDYDGDANPDADADAASVWTESVPGSRRVSGVTAE